MYLINLKLPKGDKYSDLSEKVMNLLTEVESTRIRCSINETSINELYEIKDKGAIEFYHSITCKNYAPHFNVLKEGGETIKLMPSSPAGCLLLLGFDESSQYFEELKFKISETLGDYLVKLEDSITKGSCD